MNRRHFILGATSLVASPALVRADSLMQLRGVLLDPWVIAFRAFPDRDIVESGQLIFRNYCDQTMFENNNDSAWSESCLNGPITKLQLQRSGGRKEWERWLFDKALVEYNIKRVSEVNMLKKPILRDGLPPWGIHHVDTPASALHFKSISTRRVLSDRSS